MTEQTKTLVSILERGLLDQAKKELIDKIVLEHVESFEQDLRDRAKEMLEGITLGKVEAWEDMVQMRDKLAVEFHWTDEDAS